MHDDCLESCLKFLAFKNVDKQQVLCPVLYSIMWTGAGKKTVLNYLWRASG